MKRYFLILIKLLIAVGVYIFCRPSNLRLNVLIDQLFGFEPSFSLHNCIYCSSFPDFVIYSLPAAIWLNATNSAIVLSSWPKYFMKYAILGTTAFCVTSEFMQELSFIPGSFDIFDLLLYFILGLYPLIKIHEKHH